MTDSISVVKNPANSEFYVYVHLRLASNIPFYVGKGHGERAHSHRSRNDHWRSIVAKDGGLRVHLLAEHLDEEFAFFVEVEMIDVLRKRGYRLANRTTGGEGVRGFVFSEASKEKMRAKRMSPEARAKQRAAKLGKKFSEERRAEMSVRMKADPRVKGRRPTRSMKGFVHSAETRAKMSAAAKGRPPSNKGKPMLPHVRQALVEAQARRSNFSHTEDTKRKISEALRGKQRWSDEDRAKMSDTRSRAVICLDTGQIFKSALAAAQSCGVNYRTLVGQCCRGLIPEAHGKRFAYTGAAKNE